MYQYNKSSLNVFEKLGFFIIEHFWKFVGFCFVGLSTFFIDLIFFNIFYRFGFGFILARISSAVLAIAFNFNVNRNFIFAAREVSIKKQFKRWIIIAFVALTVNTVIGKTVLIFLGESVLNANIAFVVAVIVTIPITFLSSLFWIFKKKD